MAVLHVLSTLLLVAGVVLSRPNGEKEKHGPTVADGTTFGKRLARPLEKGAPHPSGLSFPAQTPNNLAARMRHRGSMPRLGSRGYMHSMGPKGHMPHMRSRVPMPPMGSRGSMPPMGFPGSLSEDRLGMMPPNGFPQEGEADPRSRMIMTPMGPMLIPQRPPGPNSNDTENTEEPSPEQIQRIIMIRRMMMMQELARRSRMGQGNPHMPIGPMGPMMRPGSAGPTTEKKSAHNDAGNNEKSDAAPRRKTSRNLITAAAANREPHQGGKPVQIPHRNIHQKPHMRMPSQMPDMGMPSQMPHIGMPSPTSQMGMPPTTGALPLQALRNRGLHGYASAGQGMDANEDTANDDEEMTSQRGQYGNMILGINGVPGPVQLPVKDLQSLMTFEHNLQNVRAELLKSFYTDLIAYRQITQQIQKRMIMKLAMIQMVEARMAMPLRGTVAMGITAPFYSN